MENVEPLYKICRNCDSPLPEQAKFCPACGQKDTNGKVSVKTLLESFWNYLFHLDNKILYAFRHLLVPGKVSEQYFLGRIQKYPNPLHLFFVAMFFFLTAMHFATRDIGFNLSWYNSEMHVEMKLGGTQYKSDEISSGLHRYAHLTQLWQAYEQLPDSVRTTQALHVMNNIIKDTGNPVAPLLDSFNLLPTNRNQILTDSLHIGLWTQSPNISLPDFATLHSDSLADKYHIYPLTDRAILRQIQKLSKNPNALGNFYLGSFTWTFLVQVLLMSGVFWLLFRKKRIYYIEHLIFQLHSHAAGLLIFALGLALGKTMESGFYTLPFMLWILIAFWQAIKRFYQLSPLKTTAYWALLVVIYAILISVIFSGSFFLAVLLF